MIEVRLIDANAFCAFLREVSTRQHYEKLLCKEDKFPTVADVIEAICCDLDGTSINGFDNAPTVEPQKVPIANVTFDENKLKNIVQTEVIEKIKSGELVIKDERPKGEWNYIQAGMAVCPFCGARPHEDYKDFCAKCGADMRGD